MTEAVAEVTKPGRTIVTGETIDAFVVQKTAEKEAARSGVKPDPVSDEAGKPARADQSGSGEAAAGNGDGKGNAEPAGEGATGDPETDEAIQQVGKKNPKIEKRFSELSERRKAAEAEAKAAKEEAQRLRDEAAQAARERDELKAKYEPPKPDVLPPEPKREQFQSDEDFLQARDDWAGDKREHELRKKDAAEKAQKALEENAKKWKAAEDAFRKEVPDYDDAIQKSGIQIRPGVFEAVQEAIRSSEIGPRVLHYVATTKGVAERINDMSPAAAAAEIGKIEARLEKPAGEGPKVALAEVSKAPPPITPLKGSGTVDTTPVDASGQPHFGSFAQYQAWKQKQIKSGKWR